MPPHQPQVDSVDKWSFLRNPSLSVPALDDIVTKILRDDSTDVELPTTAAAIFHEAGDVTRHVDQWDHMELSDVSAKSQSCTSDVFSFDGYKSAPLITYLRSYIQEFAMHSHGNLYTVLLY